MKNVRRKLSHIRPSWHAILTLWKEEFSFRFQTVCGLIVIALSFVFNISRVEFFIVLVTIGTVLAVEALNTAIEELCNHVTPSHHPQIGKVKDLGSGASLLIGVTAVIVIIFVFLPHVLPLL